MTDTTTIPEPTDGRRVVVDTGALTNPLRLFWRDDKESAGRTDQADERWFDDENSDPLGWGEVCRNAKQVFLCERKPWGPLKQPDDESMVAVRLIVERIVRDVEYDRSEYEQAKTDDELSHLIDADASDMDGASVVIEANGTEIRSFQ